MYHYVRPLQNSKYPRIKGLELDSFIEQIHFLKKNYVLIRMEDVLDALYKNKNLPEKAALLTFDDGYLDHYLNVFPILKKLNIQGSFFVPVQAVEGRKVLDVNKIHFILASATDTHRLLLEIKSFIQKYKDEYRLNDYDFYFKKLAVASRMDSQEIIFIKRLLQVELGEEVRGKIVNELFQIYVGLSEEDLSKELYMNPFHIESMISEGMHFGAHGYNHYWWDKLELSELKNEISKSAQFLRKVGMNPEFLTACYPYGAYNPQVIEQLIQHDFKAAFSTKVALATVTKEAAFELPRFDTNDIGK